MKTLEDALIFAADAHRGQTDKAGKPYVAHPLRVMNNLGLDATLEEQMAALLHDVVEDCGVSLDDLRAAGFDEAVVVAVDHLTKNAEGERDYQKTIERAAANPIARRVKMADLTDNMDLARIARPTAEDLARVEKYRKAKAWLENRTF